MNLPRFDVCIVGAGPVGMTGALDLAQRGVRVAILEARAEASPANAKCNTVAARTMEIFRDLGFADDVRATGLPEDYPTDVIYATSLTGHLLTRIILPSRNERFGADGRSASGYPDSHWLTNEPVHRVSQYFLEPVMRQHMAKTPGITAFWEHTFVSFEDEGDAVTVLSRAADGTEKRFECRYLIGCDGGHKFILARPDRHVAWRGDEVPEAPAALIDKLVGGGCR